jgi:cyclophilin family peptidyl-prolyl cis-trans isomerase
MKNIIITLAILFMAQAGGEAQKSKETIVLIETTMGNMKVKLYNETPHHRDNFIKLVNEKYYDGVLFHRVIKDFMIQTGDPNSKNAPKGANLGSGGPKYTIPAEFNTKLIHKKGALAAARTGDNVNPKKESSGSQFYIVQGKVANDAELNSIEANYNNNLKMQRMRDYLTAPENAALKNEFMKFQQEHNNAKLDSLQKIVSDAVEKKFKNEGYLKYTEEQIKEYKTVGGTPFLDMNYTVFGEVIEGMDLIDKIAAVKTLPGDRPENDIKIITMKIVPN